MGLSALLRRFRESHTEREKREILESFTIDELQEYIARPRGIDITQLRTKEEIINAILEAGVGKKFIEGILTPSSSNIERVILEYWRPRRFRNEDGFRYDLSKFFEEKFGPDHVKTSGRSNPDIVIDDVWPIEVKLDLLKNTERHRLFGQINEYKKRYSGTVFVVNCVTNEIHDQWREIKMDFSGDRRVKMIEKSV